MRYKNNRNIHILSDIFDKFQKWLHFSFSKRSGRFIQNQHLRIIIESPHNLDQLLFTGTKFLYRHIKRNVKMQFISYLNCLLISYPFTDQSFARLISQTDILRSCEHSDQITFLVHHANSSLHRFCGISVTYFFSFKIHISIINGINACKHFAECTFSSSVFSNYRNNFFIMYFEIHMINCNIITKFLCRAFESKYSFFFHYISPANLCSFYPKLSSIALSNIAISSFVSSHSVHLQFSVASFTFLTPQSADVT